MLPHSWRSFTVPPQPMSWPNSTRPKIQMQSIHSPTTVSSHSNRLLPSSVLTLICKDRLTILTDHPNFPHHKKAGSQRAKALPGLNLLDRSRRGSNAASLTSANYHEDEMEKGIVMSPGRSDYTVDPNYPPTSPSSGGLKRFLGSKGTNNSPGLIDQGVLTSPAPAYSTTIGGIDDFTLTTANPARAGTDG